MGPRQRGDHQYRLRWRGRRVPQELPGLSAPLAGLPYAARACPPVSAHLRECPALCRSAPGVASALRLRLIGDIDTLIAATAVEYGLILVTTDGDFSRIPGRTVRLLPPGALKASTP